jgi:hypothetical protein
MSKRAEPRQPRHDTKSDEPVGIVISNGSRREEVPRFAAYVWGPVPDAEPADELAIVA